jgi:hypothetical protein
LQGKSLVGIHNFGIHYRFLKLRLSLIHSGLVWPGHSDEPEVHIATVLMANLRIMDTGQLAQELDGINATPLSPTNQSRHRSNHAGHCHSSDSLLDRILNVVIRPHSLHAVTKLLVKDLVALSQSTGYLIRRDTSRQGIEDYLVDPSKFLGLISFSSSRQVGHSRRL